MYDFRQQNKFESTIYRGGLFQNACYMQHVRPIDNRHWTKNSHPRQRGRTRRLRRDRTRPTHTP